MEDLASILLHSRNQAHVFHLRISGPGAFAAHLALQEYYDGIIPIFDKIVETYQGKRGLIEFKSGGRLDNDASTGNILSYFGKLTTVFETLRKAPELQESWLQNQLDMVSELLYTLQYKLTHLS